MSMQARQPHEVPEETRRVAQAAFPKGNLYMRLRDELGELYSDSLFADLFPKRGQPAVSPGRLALITVMQFAEGLSDRQAAEAVRARIDWKYALGLQLTDPGFDYSVLSEFRQRLIQSQRSQQLLDVLLQELKNRGLLKERGRARTDSTHVLAAVRALNRVELVGETMRRALNELAEADPDWLREVAKLEWYMRYGQRFDNIRLPKGQVEREKLIETIGADGLYLLSSLNDAPTPTRERLLQLAGVEMLRQVWVQQFSVIAVEYQVEDSGESAENGDSGEGRDIGAGAGTGTGEHTDSEQEPDQPSQTSQISQVHVKLRADDNQPPGERRIHSPYDGQARYSAKRGAGWVGYKVHLTETCDDEQMHVITHVETTTAVVQDVSMTQKIHVALAGKELLPGEHLMDAGYVGADLLVEAKRAYGVEVLGPVKKDVRWQANTEGGYDLSEFDVDWESRTVTCPRGHQAKMGRERINSYNKAVIGVEFKQSQCRPCPVRALCAQAKGSGRRLLLRPQAQHAALQRVRREQETTEFRQRYAKRSGIEGTISQGVRSHGVRRSRYVGEGKTHLQMVATGTAMNLHRLYNWLTEAPRSATRVSAFASLAPDPSLIRTCWRAA